MIDEQLVSHLNDDAAIATAATEIAVGEVPANADGTPVDGPYIWLSNYSEEDLADLDAFDDSASTLTKYSFDLEVCGEDIDAVKELARLVKKRLRGHAGTFGSDPAGTCQGIYIENKGDDYIAINSLDVEDQIVVVAFDVTIWADDSQDDS